MAWSDPDAEFRKGILFGSIGSLVGVALNLHVDVFEPFVIRSFLTVLSVMFLSAALYYARKSQTIPI